MATLLDVQVVSTAWTNIHTARSLPAGTAITVQNKTSRQVIFFVSTAAPTGNDGLIVQGNDLSFLEISPSAGEYLFVKSVDFNSLIGVQV